ncbi:hypothetical protein D3C86_1882890 [compost metagenome]
MICWVRRAVRAEASVGRAIASSLELVCSDWVPPSTAASAEMAVRTMLLSGCWAVRLEPAVWVWKRSCQLLGSWALKRSRMILAHTRRAARNLATSSSRSVQAQKKNESCGAKRSTSRPRSSAACT